MNTNQTPPPEVLGSPSGSPSSIPGAAWHDEYLKAADRAIRREMERDNALEIIRRLVTAKNEKDAHGVTARYREMKKGLWEAARKILPENADVLAPAGEKTPTK